MKARVLITATFLCLLSPVLLNSVAWGGTIYKWTDASGQVHFADQAPDGVKSEKMSVDTGITEKMTHPSADTGSPTHSQAAAANASAGTQAKNPDAMATANDQRQKNCDLAKKNLQILENHSRIRIKGKDGKLRYLTPKEIQTKKSQYQQVVKESCTASSSQ